MKILIFSPSYLPVTGGLENMVRMLATEFARAGNDVELFTLVGDHQEDKNDTNYTVYRNASWIRLWTSYCNCDIFFQVNISLKGIWPIFLKRKPFFVSHQITYINLDGSINFLERIKRWLTVRATNISCSAFVRSTLPSKKGIVIPNAYNNAVFWNRNTERPNDVIVVARLVSDKGISTLIEAISILKAKYSKTIALSIVGEGPEKHSLQRMITDLRLEKFVSFEGKLTGHDLAARINTFKVMVVPSLWKEPFGIVALEGLACGCKMVVSKDGGLAEAINCFGYTFNNGDAEDLSTKILDALNGPEAPKQELADHLSNHQAAHVAGEYLNAFRVALEKKDRT